MSFVSKLKTTKTFLGNVVYHVKMKRFLKKIHKNDIDCVITVQEDIQDKKDNLARFEEYPGELREYDNEAEFLLTKLQPILRDNHNINTTVAAPFMIFDRRDHITMALVNYSDLLKSLGEFERDLFDLYVKFKIFW